MENNIYEQRLLNLIDKYKLYAKKVVDSTYVHGIIMNLFQQKCLDKRVALWGAGRSNSLTSHASVILTKYSSLLRGMVCLIDSCEELQGKTFMNYKIISPKEIKEYAIDVIIVASRSSADSIKSSIHEFAPQCEVIDIYQELRNRGIHLLYNFYEEMSSYRVLYDLRIEYEKESDYKAKACILRQLIGTYLDIRDMYYALYFMEEYINKQYAAFEEIESVRLELKKLIDEIRNACRKRKNDVNMHFIDALREMDVYSETEDEHSFQYLIPYFSKGLFYKNCYSTGATTYESIISILQGKYSYSCNVYENNFIFKFDEIPLFKQAYEHGMDINLLSSEEWRIVYEDKRVNYINQIHMSQKLWTMFCVTAASDKPQFNFLYYAWELHFPLACGYHRKTPVTMNFPDVGVKDMSEFIEGQFQDCLDYMEKEFSFYSDFYSDDSYVVIFSDHSQVVYDKENFMPYYMYYKNKERATHCVLSISGPNIQPYVEDNYVSLIEFTNIIQKNIFEKKYYTDFPQTVRYQYYNIHNKNLRDVARERGYEDYIDGMIVIMNREYIYTHTATGKDELYRQENLQIDISETDQGKQIIEELRGKENMDFPGFLERHL